MTTISACNARHHGVSGILGETFASKYKKVRYLFVFVLVIQFSSGNVLGDELAKIPFLLHHFNVYKAEAKGSFFAFLRLHYADTMHRKADPAHRNLPLQSISANSLSFALPPAHPFSRMQARLDENDRELPLRDETLLPSDFRARLLRPPRV